MSDRIVLLSKRPSRVSEIITPAIDRSAILNGSAEAKPISIRSRPSGRASSAISNRGAG